MGNAADALMLARPAVRRRQIGIRVSEEEHQSLERIAWSGGQKVADWARDQLLARVEHTQTDRISTHVFTELIGLQMLLMGFFSPLLEGRQISAEQYQQLVRSVQAGKGKRARELLLQRLSEEAK